MAGSDYKDYYKLLQVHYDASAQIIKAAYDQLSETFQDDAAQQGFLREAYAVLSDENRRAVYHREWLRQFAEHTQMVPPSSHPYHAGADDQKTSAEYVLDDFFRALFLMDWENAYLRLASQDRSNVSLHDFIEWRTAIADCYEMQEYKVKYLRMLDSITIESITYHQAAEFQVTVADRSLKNREITTDSFRKYVIYENNCWRVCLGVRDVQASIRKYRLQKKNSLLQNEENANAALQESRLDPMTGLLNETEFFREAAREVERNRRYHNPFTLLSFQVHCEDKSRETACICHLADTIGHACRSIDIAARLDNNQIICLLAETPKESAEAAANKFLRLLTNNPPEHYRVTFGLAFYNGFASLSDTVLSCCRMAGLPPHY